MANLDADLRNADWTKGSWRARFEGVNTLGGLLRMLDQQGLTIEQFKKLPVYRMNVDRVPLLQKL